MEKKLDRILIVDDEISFLAAMTQALHKICGYHGDIAAVENGEKAIEKIKSNFYDICFLDLNMPDMNGFEVMEQITEISPKTKIAIMTGSYRTDEMNRSIENNASALFPKPVNLDEVKAFITDSFAEYHCFKDNETSHENRHFDREPYESNFRYSVTTADLLLHLKGDTIDTSSTGIGMKTDRALEPGSMLNFETGFKNKKGIVKWCKKIDDSYRAGIKFV